jgi:hypothetical protein
MMRRGPTDSVGRIGGGTETPVETGDPIETDEPAPEDESQSMAWIAGAVIGPIAAIALVALAFWFGRRRGKGKDKNGYGENVSQINQTPGHQSAQYDPMLAQSGGHSGFGSPMTSPYPPSSYAAGYGPGHPGGAPAGYYGAPKPHQAGPAEMDGSVYTSGSYPHQQPPVEMAAIPAQNQASWQPPAELDSGRR